MALTSFDIRSIVQELQSQIENTRINSFISCGTNTYLLKSSVGQHLIQPQYIDQLQEQIKPKLLIESGVRCHLTKFQQKIAPATSFSKFINNTISNKIILTVRQYQFDRIIIICIGNTNGQVQYNLVIELYGKGNVILTDDKFKIVVCQNSYKNVSKGLNYLDSLNNENATLDTILNNTNETMWYKLCEKYSYKTGQQGQFRYMLAKEYNCGGALASMILRYFKLSNSCKVKSVDEQIKQQIRETIEQLLYHLANQIEPTIYYYPEDMISTNDITDQQVKKSLLVAEFYNYDICKDLQNQSSYTQNQIEHLNQFNVAMDQYYQMLKTCQDYKQQYDVKVKVQAKQDSIENEQIKRQNDLLGQAKQYKTIGDIIMLKQVIIDQIVQQINQLFNSNQVTWSSLTKVIENEQYPILKFVSSADLVKHEIEIMVVLSQEDVDLLEFQSMQELLNTINYTNQQDDETVSQGYQEEDQILNITFKINETSGKIATRYYNMSNKILEKLDKTQDQIALAIKKISQQTQQALKQNQQQLSITKIQQQQFWYQKFHWFISSDGYLVIGGRDAQSNEILIKKFLTDRDIFVHAEITGASCVIIKNDNKLSNDTYPLCPPQLTLQEAAQLSVVNSRAWEGKLLPKAYWVYSNQVSKSAPTGQYINTGSFVIKGKKNYVPVRSFSTSVILLFKNKDECNQLSYQLNKEFEQQQEQLKYEKTLQDQLKQPEEEQEQTTTIQTKKASMKVVKAIDVKKQLEKDQKKAEQKQRHDKIKQQKFNAKIKRLEKEGKKDIVEKLLNQQQQEEIIDDQQQQQKMFCIYCGSDQHFLDGCDKYQEFIDNVHQYIPQYFKQYLIQNAKQEDFDENSEIEQNNEKVQEQQQQQNISSANLSDSIKYYSIQYSDNSQYALAMVCPHTVAISLKQKYPDITFVTLKQGKTQKGIIYKQIQNKFLNKYQDKEQAQIMIQNILEWYVTSSIPGQCQFE